jgi:CAAX protease family protein
MYWYQDFFSLFPEQGVVLGLLAVTCVMMLLFAAGGYSFGGLALHGGSLVKYGIGWALVFLMVGFVEELLFRGYLQFTLATAIGFWPSAILLSIVFGFVHLGSRGENWMGGATAALFGLFLCLTLRRAGNLWFALGLHASFVYGETFIYSVPNSGFPSYGHLLNSTLQGPQWLTGGSVGPEASVMMFVELALLFALLGFFGPRGGLTELIRRIV